MYELYEKMEQEYSDTLKELPSYEKAGTSCGDFAATIVTGGDWYEWFISEHEVEVE